MRIRLFLASIIGLMVASCAQQQADPPATMEAAAIAAAVPSGCVTNPNCDYAETHTYKDDVTHNKAAFLCAAWLYACHSQYPNPVPDAGSGGSAATGGASSVSTGGALSTGGKPGTGGSTGGSTPTAKCIAAKAKDSHVLNVASQTGQSASDLAKTMCADPTVLGGFQ